VAPPPEGYAISSGYCGAEGQEATRISSTCRPRARRQALTTITAAEVLPGPRRHYERAAGQDRLAGGITVLTGVRTTAGYQPPR
jgi:hypothetical protein